jgi:hypothetical protein
MAGSLRLEHEAGSLIRKRVSQQADGWHSMAPQP